MNPRALRDFLPHLYGEVSGVPEIYALTALRDTCTEFCEQTLLVREQHTGIPISPSVSDYELVPELCDSRMARVLNVWINGALISAVTPEIGSRMAASFESNVPAAYFCREAGLITLVPTPSVAASMNVDMAIKPEIDADEVPEVLYTQYRRSIVRGAAAQLMAMPARPWTDVDHAVLYRKMYWSEMQTTHRADHWDGFGRPIQRPVGRFL